MGGLALANEKDVISSPKVPERGSTEGKRQFDVAAAQVLERRVQQAVNAGATNIAVDASFLLELLAATKHAMTRAAYKSQKEI